MAVMTSTIWNVFLVLACFVCFFVKGQVVSQEFDLRRYYYVLLPCNNATGRMSASTEDCISYFSNTNPFLADTLARNGNALGSLSFDIVFTGNYTINVGGASGGCGVCSRSPGRGYMFTVTGFPLTKGNRVTVRVGQSGTSACDTNPSHSACLLKDGDPRLVTECEMLKADSTFVNDGGGGGGGFSDFFFQLSSSTVFLLTAAGGGGAPAFNGPRSGQNESDALEMLLNFTSLSLNGEGSMGISPGAGGGSEATSSSRRQDGNFQMDVGFRDLGGQDCLLDETPSIFPETVGGFGSGGGGCGNGGGGGGYQGGSVVFQGNTAAGRGGISFANFEFGELTNKSFNDGDGFVTLFFETCECSGNCLPNFNRMVFRCQCPNGTLLSEDGKDCITDIVPEFSSIEPVETVTIFNGLVGVYTQVKPFPNSLFVYNLEVEFVGSTNRTSTDAITNISDSCVILLLQGVSVVGASEIVRIGTEATRTSTLISRMTDSGFGPYEQFNGRDPIGISGVELVSVSAVCEATLSWNVSIRTEPAESITSARFQLDTLLVQLLETCRQSNDSCLTLGESPPTIPSPPLNDVAIATSVIVGVAAIIIVCLVIVLGLVYYRYRKKKVYVTVSNVKKAQMLLRNHYENLCPDDGFIEPLLHKYENADDVHMFQYVQEEDSVYNRLKELRPKHGIESQPFSLDERSGDNDWECNRQDLIFIKKIGEGKFGEIVLMKTKNLHGYLNTPVAVKTLSRSVAEGRERFFSEIKLLQTFHHPNIVHSFGYCNNNPSNLDAPPLMILEYMSLGDLLNLLIANKPKDGETSNLTEKHMCGFAVGIARALSYLSQQNYIHRDVAARNVLVDQHLTVKLTDFSLVQKLSENGQYRMKDGGSLPVRWMSPESLLYGIYTVHTDCWSYGVFLWEMVTYGDFPHENSDMVKLTEAAENKQLQVVPFTVQCFLYSSPSGCLAAFTKAIKKCQSHEPALRPTFQSLEDTFISALETLDSNVDSTSL